MIQSNELRVGNKIRYTAHILTVAEIHKNSEVKTIEAINGFLDCYEGIPLTPELLEKCGFVSTRDGGTPAWWHGRNPVTHDFLIVVKYSPSRSLYYYQNVHFKLKYLHELQNLFHALTGEELTINLLVANGKGS